MACKWINACPMRDLERKGAVNDTWRIDYCESASNWKNCVRYRMEEQFLPHSDDMLPDGSFVDLSQRT